MNSEWWYKELWNRRRAYWGLISFIALLFFGLGVLYDPALWIVLIPIVLATFGALTIDRSWRSVAFVLAITLLMYIVYCLRHFGPY
jgi:hypothetical protein